MFNAKCNYYVQFSNDLNAEYETNSDTRTFIVKEFNKGFYEHRELFAFVQYTQLEEVCCHQTIVVNITTVQSF